jgi:hypothetical protein
MLIVSRESRRDTYFLLMVMEQGWDGTGGIVEGLCNMVIG